MSIGETIKEHANPGDSTAEQLARALGWFSFGLGIAELAAPGPLARALGLEGKESLLRAYGGREIAAGAGALSSQAELGMWSRVVGDLVDLGTLAIGMKSPDRMQRRNAGMAIAAVAGITALDAVVATMLTRQRLQEGQGASESGNSRRREAKGAVPIGQPNFASSSKTSPAPSLEAV